MARPERVLAVFPHPDDAAFFAAGTLARWIAEGCHVTAVCCTSGNLGTLRPNQSADDVAAQRERELRAANAMLGVQETLTLGHPDGGFMQADALYVELVRLVRQYRPDRLLTLDPWLRYEVHPDHELVGRVASRAAAFAAFPLLHPEQLVDGLAPHSPSEIWFMGLLGRAPNCYVDIAGSIETKIKSALQFEGTFAILAAMFEPGMDPGDVSPAEQRKLAAYADRWLRKLAGQVGRRVELAAAEAFFVEKCLPGHFDNMDRLMNEMLDEPAAPPTVLR